MQERNAAATTQTRATYKPGVLQAKLRPRPGTPAHHGRCYPSCALSLPSAALKTKVHTDAKCEGLRRILGNRSTRGQHLTCFSTEDAVAAFTVPSEPSLLSTGDLADHVDVGPELPSLLRSSSNSIVTGQDPNETFLEVAKVRSAQL